VPYLLAFYYQLFTRGEDVEFRLPLPPAMSVSPSVPKSPGAAPRQPVHLRERDLAAARAGDRDAMIRLIAPYSTSLYGVALRMTHSPVDAEDVRQETFVKVLLRMGQFTGNPEAEHDDLRAWISRIAVNSSIDLIRRRRESKNVSLEEPTGGPGETLSGQIMSREENPEERFARRQTRLLFAQAIRRLAPELRQVCLLRDVLQYSTQEVADRLGISTLAVRLRLFRAHGKLRETLHATEKSAALCKQQAARNADSRNSAEARSERFLSLQAVTQCACGD
jgi:RNA polymerase sigma-70 factor (ECF subfamily)